MYTIEWLEKEHEEITVVINRMEEECIAISKGKEISFDFFEATIRFIRNYADGMHHKKEEDILFKYMMEDLGDVAEKLIRTGMLTEHQMARYYVMELETHLNKYKEEKTDKSRIQILANAMSYVNLLRVHIDKENNVVYPFGEKNLSEETKTIVEMEMKEKKNAESKEYEEKEQLLNAILMHL